MRENRTPGSVRGTSGNRRSYRDKCPPTLTLSPTRGEGMKSPLPWREGVRGRGNFLFSWELAVGLRPEVEYEKRPPLIPPC